MTDDTVRIEERRSPWRNLSPIWLVPILAVAVALFVAYRSYSDRGTEIKITFENASGITPGETTIRYRDVVIGRVERLSFTPDLAKVVVVASVSNVVADTIPADAQFYVVRPEVTTRGISGLSTVLSGVYIGASWKPTDGDAETLFTGLETAPPVGADQAGTRVVIRAPDGNRLQGGAPVLYHGIEVGTIETPKLDDDGTGVTVGVFIQAPHDKRLTTATRFWDMSGFTVSFGAKGLQLDVASLASLVGGGIAFDNVFSGGDPLPADYTYDLYPDETSARDSIFSQVGVNAVKLAVEFDGSVNGLTSGATVQYRGLKVGEVNAISAYVRTVDQTQVVRLRAVISIDPQAIGLPDGSGGPELMDFLETAIANGLRAKLATQNLFTSSLMIQLVDVPDAPPAELARPEGSFPIIPAVASDITDFTATAEGVLRRINDLPIEELLTQATSMMASIEAIAEDPATRQIPGKAVGVLDGAQGFIASDDTQALPGELRKITSDLGGLIEELKTRGTIDRLVSVVERADVALGNVSTASEDFPALVAEVKDLAEKANGLPLDQVVRRAEGLLVSIQALTDDPATRRIPGATAGLIDDARGVIGSPDAQALPAALRQVADDLSGVVSDLRTRGTIERLSTAVDNADVALANLRTASDDFPALMDEIRALVAKADALPAREVLAQATKLLGSTDALLSSPATQEIPGNAADALASLRDILVELREQKAVDALIAAMDSTTQAATDVSDSVDGVPELVDTINDIAVKVDKLDIEGLIASAQEVLDAADRFIDSDDMRSVPPALAQALDQVRETLKELREGGAVENLNGTLASTRRAADKVADATEGLPQLAARLDQVARQAEATLAAYGQRSSFNQETLQALRDVREAANAVARLARTLERNPNSLLLGK